MTTNQAGLQKYSTVGYAARAPFFWWSPKNSADGGITISGTSQAALSLTFGWYQPKHQEHDYYKNNFRLNKGDSVQLGSMCTVGTTGPPLVFTDLYAG